MESKYKKSFQCYTMEVKIFENGRKIDKMVVTDTVKLRKLITKYGIR